MTLSRYFMLAIFVVAVMSYSSKIDGQYQSTTVGATVGGAAGVILSSGTPLGLIGGIVVGAFIGNKMDGSDTTNDSVVTLRQNKLLNENS
jgi:osmotically inducible lipoprotein OsmB